jgi:Tol biopolymer transport system component
MKTLPNILSRRSIAGGLFCLGATFLHPLASAQSTYGIVFASDQTGAGNVWRMNSDGSDPTELTSYSTAQNVDFISPSPDGSEIAYLIEPAGTRQIWMMNSDGSDQHLVTTLTGSFDHLLGWTPDGSALLYTNDPGFTGVPNILNLTTLASTVLFQPSIIPGMNDVYSVHFNADGSRILWTTQTGSNSPSLDVFVAPFANNVVNSAQITRLTNNSRYDDPALFSPNGQQVVIGSENGSGGVGQPFITTVQSSLVSGSAVQIGQALANTTPTAWGPGPSILLEANATNGSDEEIYTINPDGTGLTALTTDGNNSLGAWILESSTVPEPSTYSIVAGALALTLAALRKRRS